MIEEEVIVPTAAGAMECFLVRPEEGGPFPVVLFYMDAGGRREELDDMARRLASVGYFVMLPDLYYRRRGERGVAAAGRSAMVAEMNALSNALVCEDTLALLEFVVAQPQARAGPVGLLGYCMSGPFVFAAAAAFPERVAAAASFHGVRLCTEALDSPHRSADRVQGELYFGCAEEDEWAPPEMIEALTRALQDAGVTHRVETYPGTTHGFVFPGRPAYHREAAERHWERLLALFQRTLQQRAQG